MMHGESVVSTASYLTFLRLEFRLQMHGHLYLALSLSLECTLPATVGGESCLQCSLPHARDAYADTGIIFGYGPAQIHCYRPLSKVNGHFPYLNPSKVCPPDVHKTISPFNAEA